MSSFTGGRLKLKGEPVGGVKKKKKSSSKGGAELALSAGDAAAAGSGGAGAAPPPPAEAVSKQQQLEQEAAAKEARHRALHGVALTSPAEGEDRRTEAERRFQARQVQLEAERLKKQAGKSHRDRVNEFNQYLSTLSEHHDIPRVGPG